MHHDAKTLMRTFIEDVVGGGRLDLIAGMTQPDVIDEANLVFGGPPGRAGFTGHVKGFHRNIGHPVIAIERIAGDTESVMAWWSFTGTHVGPWLDRAPTGEPIHGTVFSFFDLTDGLVSRYSLWLHARFVDDSVIFDSTVFDSTKPEA